MEEATRNPGLSGFDPERLDIARSILVDHVARHSTPCAAAAVVRSDGPAAIWTEGRHAYEESSRALSPSDLFDLASVTKVMAATTLAMLFYADGKLDLDAPVQDLVPEFQGDGKDRVTARMLLSHCSGLPAHARYYLDYQGREQIEPAVCQTRLTHAPGTETAYSDIGFILLGMLLDRLAGERLDRLFASRVAGPLGLADTGYRPIDIQRCVPTEEEAWRGRLIQGEVHDGNAFAMGGIAPHAGLFATIGDAARFALTYLRQGDLAGERVLPAEAIRTFRTPAGLVSRSSWGLGWDTVSPEGSTAGRLFSPGSYGSLGFTGTSIWIDPERDLAVVLLTNRVHPTRDNWGIRELRPAFHDAVGEALVGR